MQKPQIRIDDFNRFCDDNYVKGSTRSLLLNMYKKTGNLGEIASKLRELGHTPTIQDETDHTINITESRKTLSLLHPNIEKRSRFGHQFKVMMKRIHFGGKEHEGD